MTNKKKKANKRKPKKKKKASKLNTLITIVFLLVILFAVLLVLDVPIFVKMNGESTITVEVNSEYVDEGAKSTFGGDYIAGSGQVDTTTLGTYKIEYSNLIQTITRTVNVVDSTAPEIILNGGDYVYVYYGNEYEELGFSISDNYDDLSEDDVTITSNVDTSAIGTYEITYSATDSSGNTTTITRTVEIIDTSYDFSNSITDSYGLDNEIIELITEFFNRYYYSQKYLSLYNVQDLYSSNSQEEGYLFDTALKYMIATRELSSVDLHIDDAYFDFTIGSVSYDYNSITVLVYHDDTINFTYLDGITSQQSDIETTFTFVEENGSYYISDVYHEEGFYLIINRLYSSTNNYIEALDEVYEEAIAEYSETYAENEEERTAVNNGEVTFNETADVAYDREAAVEYALSYAIRRNSSYVYLTSNCVNFVSQCLYAGGFPMTSSWYNYGGYNYNTSWTYIPSFQSYIESSYSLQIYENLNLYLAEEGDIIFIDYMVDTYGNAIHVVLVTDVIYDDDGNIVDYLISGNTNDQLNWPLSALSYPYL